MLLTIDNFERATGHFPTVNGGTKSIIGWRWNPTLQCAVWLYQHNHTKNDHPYNYWEALHLTKNDNVPYSLFKKRSLDDAIDILSKINKHMLPGYWETPIDDLSKPIKAAIEAEFEAEYGKSAPNETETPDVTIPAQCLKCGTTMAKLTPEEILESLAIFKHWGTKKIFQTPLCRKCYRELALNSPQAKAAGIKEKDLMS